MKLFIKKITPFVCFCFFLFIFLPVFIDPHNVFHVKNIRTNGVEENKNFIKMRYLLANPDKYDSYIFGSSRVGVLHGEKLTGERCYNMTYSRGLPAEALDNIKTMLTDGITVKKVYLGLDEFSYISAPEEHYTQPMRMPYEYARDNPTEFLKTYLDPKIALESLKISFAKEGGFHGDTSDFYEYGWWAGYGIDSLAPYEFQLEGPIREYGRPETYAAVIETMREMTALCAENGIELVVFTNPLFVKTYCEAVVWYDYLGFLRALAEVTPYVNFSGLNRMTLDFANYIDDGHYTAEAGDIVLGCLSGEIQPDEELAAQGFGRHVSRDNVDELISLLAGQSVEEYGLKSLA